MTYLPDDARTPGLQTFHRPGDAGYAQATAVFNPTLPVTPDEAVFASSVGEVQAIMAHAREHGQQVSVLTTGHGASKHPPMDGGILIRVEAHGEVEIDPVARRARVPAGTRWGAVAAAAAEHGLIALHGSSPDIGVVGYLLDGGLSFYGRRHGLGNSSVRAIDLVTPDGEARHVTPLSYPDLFACLLGSPGGLGVVTGIEIELYPAAAIWTGAAFWPVADAPGVLAAWRRWTADAPEAVTTALRVLRLPPDPDLPPPLTAGPVVCVDGTAIASTRDELAATEAAVDGLLTPLRAVAEPVLDSWRPADSLEVTTTHMDPPGPMPYTGDHTTVAGLDDAFLAAAGAPDGRPDPGWPLAIAELRQLGGAIGRPGMGPARNLDHFPGEAVYWGMGMDDPAAPNPEVTATLARARAGLGPWITDRVTPSFVETFTMPGDWLGGEQLQRLRLVATRVDPDGLMAGARRRLLPY